MRSGALLVALAACGGQYHVRFDPPSPTITPQQRVELFWKLRPTQVGFVKANGELVNQTLFLGDKDRVEVVSPEDLEPLVGTDSETMRYARASVAARRKANVSWWMGLALVGAGVVASGVLTEGPPFGLPTPWIGAGAVVGGVVIAYPVSRHYSREELSLRRRAFGVYTRDLGERLNVCAHGTQVVPCEAPTPTEPNEPGTPATAPEHTAGSRGHRVDRGEGVFAQANR